MTTVLAYINIANDVENLSVPLLLKSYCRIIVIRHISLTLMMLMKLERKKSRAPSCKIIIGVLKNACFSFLLIHRALDPKQVKKKYIIKMMSSQTRIKSSYTKLMPIFLIILVLSYPYLSN